jgi:SAM-dependent methyltransferase
LDERATYEPRARQEWFIVTRLARAIPDAVARWAPIAGRALDVGCGRQPFRATLEARGLSYVGLDTQQNADGTVEFVCAIDGTLPVGLLALAGFDFVLCTEVLEHVADWHAAFSNFSTLLAPGGRIVLTCPHVYPLHEEPYDFWRPTPHALRYFAARAGLRVLEERRIGDGWDVFATVMMSVSIKPARGSWNPLAYLLAGLLQLRRKFLFGALKRTWLRALVPATSRLYLSNLVVLERSGESGGTG